MEPKWTCGYMSFVDLCLNLYFRVVNRKTQRVECPFFKCFHFKHKRSKFHKIPTAMKQPNLSSLTHNDMQSYCYSRCGNYSAAFNNSFYNMAFFSFVCLSSFMLELALWRLRVEQRHVVSVLFYSHSRQCCQPSTQWFVFISEYVCELHANSQGFPCSTVS